MIDLQHRLAVIGIIVAALFGALALRLGYLQLVEGSTLSSRADANIRDTVVIPATRGRILDRNGRVLVDNLPINVVRLDLKQVERTERVAVISRLTSLLGVPYYKVQQRLNDPNNNPFEPVEIVRGVKESAIVNIDEHRDLYPGVSTGQTWQRVYPYGAMAAHVLGYVGKINGDELSRQPIDLRYTGGDLIGKAGTELSFERVLRGVPGQEQIIKDRLQRVVSRKVIRPPVPGRDVRLTIDVDVQRQVERSLAQGLVAARQNVFADSPNDYLKAHSGAMVVLDPRNGEVIAMASQPTYDPREFIPSITPQRYEELFAGDDKHSPLTNRAIAGQYPPGSTFKLFTALAALQRGVITPDSTYTDTGSFTLPELCKRNVKCKWKNAGEVAFGTLDLRAALRVSSDAFFYRLGYAFSQLPRGEDNGIQDAARLLGLGKKTGVQLPYEKSGNVPDRESRARLHRLYPKAFPYGGWSTGDFINLSIGQGEVLVTPLQLARAYAALANGGTVVNSTIELGTLDPRAPATTVAPTTTLPPVALGPDGRPVTAPTIDPRASTTTRAVGALPTSTTLPPVSKSPTVEGHVDLSDPVRQELVNGLRDVVSADTGTAYSAFAGFPLQKFPLAGKTGTAQKKPQQDYAIYVGFGPVVDPRYVVAAVIEEGGFGRQAASMTRPVFEALAGVTPGPVRVVTGGGSEH